MTAASLLTPPGTGAIAVIDVVGPQAWSIARNLFSKPLPESAPIRRHYYGRLAGDEVILASIDGQRVQIHCHGGVKIVELILKTLEAEGCVLKPASENVLARAKTLRTANILLDQLQGAFRTEIERQLVSMQLDRLTRYSKLGRHLLSPWKVVIAGPPNAGKSTLINTLLGYERAVVSPVAGTTRDAVGSVTAFDGWPVELIDTAGLRSTTDELEAEGVARARGVIAAADYTIWLHDATSPGEPDFQPNLHVANKCDLPDAVLSAGALPISALTGAGVPAMIAMMMNVLVPLVPTAGEAVPYTPELADAIDAAHLAATTGNLVAARELLESCLSVSAADEAAMIGHSL